MQWLIPKHDLRVSSTTSCVRHGEEWGQSYQSNVMLGASIGIGFTGAWKTTGTLGLVVTERNPPNQIGIISCEHIVKFEDSNIDKCVIQPSREDLLDGPKWELDELLEWSKMPGIRKED